MEETIRSLVLIGGFMFLYEKYQSVRNMRIALEHNAYWEEVVYGPERERDYARWRKNLTKV